MFSGLTDLILHPDRFFLRVSQEKVNLILPILIIWTGFVALIIGKTIPVFWVSTHFPSIVETSGGIPGVLFRYIFCHTIAPLLVLIVMIIGTYGISRLVNGKGLPASMVQNIGYAMMPSTLFTLGSLISSGLILLIFHSWPVPPGNSEWWYWTFWTTALFGILFFFWQWYLWILAVKHTQDFSFRKAAAVTIIPVVIVIWLTIPIQAWMNMILRVVSGS